MEVEASPETAAARRKPAAFFMPERQSAAARGYGRRWQKARAAFLRAHPLCAMCAPRVVAASVVDHIVPHRGDERLFWNETNWQPLCKTHHDSTKQALEKSGTMRGCDANGLPIDAAHPWNARV